MTVRTNGVPEHDSAQGPHQFSNIGAELERAAQRWGERACVVLDGMQEISFQKLDNASAELAAELRAVGVMPGDRVCLGLANSIEWVVAAFATWRAGGVAVSLSTRLVDRELRHCLSVCEPAAAIVHAQVRGRDLVLEWTGLRDARMPVFIHESPAGDPAQAGWRLPTLDAVWPSGAAQKVDRSLDSTADDTATTDDRAAECAAAGIAAILFTSGTTAAPKGVMLTHRALLGVAYEVGVRQELTCADHFFSVAPFFHCSGLMHALLTSFVHGATLHAMSRYSPETSLTEISSGGVTVSHGPLPAQIPSSLEAISLDSFDRAWAGGTPDDLLTLENNLKIKACSLWGMTETCGCFALTQATDSADIRHRTAGLPLPGLDFRIVADDGALVTSDGGRGELRIRGWSVTPGYFSDSGATAAAFDTEGWFRTGDLAEQAPGGRFRYLGRLKDTLRVGGENVSPSEIEAVLLQAEGVVDVGVIAVPHPRLGEVPVAVVVPAAGGRLCAERLRDHCEELLASFKVPHDFYTLSELPRTHATNRIQRQALRVAVDAGLAHHVS